MIAVILISVEDVEAFDTKPAGRARTTVPVWRTAKKGNTLYLTSILVRVRTGQAAQVAQRLEEIKRSEEYTFPGTVARYVVERGQAPDQIELLLIWKQDLMPSEQERERAIGEFRAALADILDWSSATYNHDRIYLHTT